MRRTQHEQMFSVVSPIADILGTGQVGSWKRRRHLFNSIAFITRIRHLNSNFGSTQLTVHLKPKIKLQCSTSEIRSRKRFPGPTARCDQSLARGYASG